MTDPKKPANDDDAENDDDPAHIDIDVNVNEKPELPPKDEDESPS